MRVIQTWHFYIGTKVSFSELPGIVHAFLDKQNLQYHRFLYYFDELIMGQSVPYLITKGSCAKAAKDCPTLGSVRFLNGAEYGSFPILYLSNIDRETGCTEKEILPYLKKYHRSYGLTNCDFYFYDIDFFQRVLPCEREASKAAAYASGHKQDYDPNLMLAEQVYGSGIRVRRDALNGSTLSLSIDLLRDGVVCDGTAYFEEMKALLPEVKWKSTMDVYLDQEEKRDVQSRNQKIQPAVEKARSYFAQQFPSREPGNSESSNFKLAPKLKKLAKQYGFVYQSECNGSHEMQKRSPRGHVLRLGVDSGPSHFHTDYSFHLQGIGFCHSLCNSMQTPSCQEEFEACSEKFFLLISKFEKDLLPELDGHYAETPDWFIPKGW